MGLYALRVWQSVPGGVKPPFLAIHGHEVINPPLPDEVRPGLRKRTIFLQRRIFYFASAPPAFTSTVMVFEMIDPPHMSVLGASNPTVSSYSPVIV